MWVYFIIIFFVGAVIGFVICVLASMGRQREIVGSRKIEMEVRA